jgi:hypothetical protein
MKVLAQELDILFGDSKIRNENIIQKYKAK